MENQTETPNSENGNPHTDLDGVVDAVALKELVIKGREKTTELETQNKQLFVRAKKAEGFEQDEEGNWIKIIRETPKSERKSEARTELKKDRQTDDLDYGQKAYLRAEGFESTEFEWVKKEMEDSGVGDIEKLLSNGYFKARLKEMRDKVSVEKAVPMGTRGSGESSQSKVEHWVNKGEMPPNTPENFELRTKVLEARLKKERSAGAFSQNPIVYGSSA